jgi:hypothetical protein
VERKVVPEGLIPMIKIATRALVVACATQGTTGPRRVEEMTGKSAGTICRWQSDAYSDLIPTDIVFLLESSIQVPVFARTLAELTGHRLVAVADEPEGDGGDIEELTADLIGIVGSGSRVGAQLGSVLQDRKVSRREARETLGVIGEHEERIGRTKRRLARLAGEGGR